MKRRSLREKRLVGLIDSTGDTGRIFGVRFIKRTNGDERTMTARLNVRKGVKGTGLPFSPEEKNLIVAYEMPHKRFRLIPIENILSLSIDGLKVWG